MLLFLAQALFVATPFTPDHSFTSGVEGPATDSAGNVYAVSYQKTDTIGRVTPDGQAGLFVTMPPGSLGNGIRFTPEGRMFVADYKGHNILEIDPVSRKISVFAHEPKMSQPNDIALAPDGTLWASDPNWKAGTGQLWRFNITKDGTLKDKKLIIEFPDFGMDGMRADVKGNLYITRHGKGTVAIV